MSGFLRSYQSLLARRPFLGNFLTCSALFATGDIIAQQFVEKKGSNHDFARTGRITIWGGGCFAPAVTVWFRVLQRIPIQSKWPAAIVRTGLDQFGFAPVIISGFFTFTTLLEGKDMQAVREKWHQSFMPTLRANWSLWIPVQLVNMAFVPPHMRVFVVSAVNVPWNTYLSLQAAKGEEPEKDMEQ